MNDHTHTHTHHPKALSHFFDSWYLSIQKQIISLQITNNEYSQDKAA